MIIIINLQMSTYCLFRHHLFIETKCKHSNHKNGHEDVEEDGMELHSD